MGDGDPTDPPLRPLLVQVAGGFITLVSLMSEDSPRVQSLFYWLSGFRLVGGPSSIWMLVLLFQHTATDRFIHVSVMRCHTSMHEQIYIFIGYVLLRIWNPYIYIELYVLFGLVACNL
mgnify:CR=1 FL=1